jgi:nitrogen fixation-related uncharacterized protein
VTWIPQQRKLRLAAAAACVLTAVLAYAPALTLPLIADDYVQIDLGRRYGGPAGWSPLLEDALYRCRATSILLTRSTEWLFGISRAAFNVSSLLVHILNCFLVLGLGLWKPVGWRVAALGAVFFAAIEVHHEAVMWYAALPELLVFTFVLATFLSWVMWMEAEHRARRWYVSALLCFVLALASKESAVCVVGLMAVAVLTRSWKNRGLWLALAPFAVLSLLYFVSIYVARSTHLHFNDGTFSLRAPFWLTLVNSSARLFWPWGYVALASVALAGRLRVRFAWAMGAWVLITLLPYSFLTYMSRVPSRHTYMASVALALVLGIATLSIWRVVLRRGAVARLLAVAIIAGCLLHNTAYLWTRKQRQFEERARATQDLLEALRASKGVVEVKCFPYGPEVAFLAAAVEIPGSEHRVSIQPSSNCRNAYR